MSEEAISESDLEPSLNSEEEYMEDEEEEDLEDMEEDEDDNDGDDEDDSLERPASAQDGRDSASATSGETSSPPPSGPASRPSSRSPSRPSSPSKPPTSPENSGKIKPPSSKTKKQKASKLTKSSKSSKGSKPSKPSKPAHMRKNIRKLLKEDQLEAGTKAAQQEEMERRKRLEQQRKDFPTPAPTGPESQLVDAASLLGEVSHLVPGLLSKQDVICLDSSGDEDEKVDPNLPGLAIEDADIIELSSGDEDALQISSESADEDAGTSGSEESSGAHTNDSMNLPDAQGRVLVNINHPADEKDLFLAPQLARAVKPHQIGGIRFLYDNLIESLERYKTSSGFGCILAHSMGLGKTLQVISFIEILLKNTEAHTVLAIVPVNTLQNWLTEFNLWLPPQEALSPETDPAVITGRNFKVHVLNDEHKTTLARAKVVEDWSRDGGVLLMGYEMYRLLSMKKSFVMGKKRKSKKPAGPIIIDLDEEDRQQELMKGIERAITRPGPDVVICDEGHRIKNYHASTSQALKNIRSRRRVVLTGYPLQNNLIEYWCMVDFVRPDFLGTRQEFSNMFERPILNGQCMDSTPQDVRLMRYRSHVLHSLLEGFVQRRGHDVLRDQLPSKEEHVILVRLSPIQRALYTEFMKRFREAGNNGWLGLNPLKAFCVCCKIWNHPDVLYEALQKENQANEQDLDLDDITSAGSTRCSAPGAGLKAKVADSSNSKVNNSLPPINPSQDRANQVITYEWAKDIMSNYNTGVLENSAKMVLLFHLIDESVGRGDKMLVFSQSLSTLSVIEDFLSKRPMPTGTCSPDTPSKTWVRNLNYYRLDGSTSASERERLINQFNDPENTATWVFLLSTRAGCLGVNLIGANRVVVFDASWNPCHDAQAVCRVYRYGQRKPCYIYRLVCDYTLEKKIYDRQVSKQGMSDRVVDDLNPVLNFTRKEVESLLHFVEEEPGKISLTSPEDMEIVIYQACRLYPHLITKQPFHHESLLVDRKESKLTKAEKRAAKKSYEDEKRASVPYSRPSYAPYYPTSDQTLTNIPAFNQRGWRPMARPDDKPVASVRPIQSTPIPMMPRQVGMGMAGSSSAGSLPVNFLQKAGVYVQRIVTTTDIVIPGANSTTDVQARISAGESIHVIRGSKGTYIRTNDGRIFAIRSGKISRPAVVGSAASRDSQGPLIHPVSNGCSSPGDQQQSSPNGEQRSSSPLSSEILREISRYTSSTGDAPASVGNELPSPTDALAIRAGNEGSSQSSEAADFSRQLTDDILTSTLEVRGSKRRISDSQGNTQIGGKRTSAASHFPGLSMGSGGLSFPPMGLNSSSLLGNLGHMNHPLLMGGSGGSSFLQTPGQTLADLQTMFPSAGSDLLRQSATGNGHLPSPSSSSLPTVFSSASTTIPMSSPSSAAPSSSLASGSLPPYLMNPNMAGLLSSGFPLNYSQSLLSEPRMFPTPLLSGSGGFPAPNSSSTTSSFLSHFNNPTSSLLGAALTQPDRHHSAENGGSSSDDDVIEVTGQ
ncbi:helicase ARIP4 [Acanthopagrus latus]|uniref:helicase ARIP4 n=1 Tax=Acanthopagrus latus TaxID=8177 RepID=UPI00187C9A2D|nr:helicase ARIP4 [Acanthopagrus latus]XP_036956945.1 helicase ARIP4 [Acanthopagrus latus]XP_036956946.1 helicase ARIP4 [Acanthopagrus latus]XP_036956947.1 helicase ARIP4 [Acanthopagrus latus]